MASKLQRKLIREMRIRGLYKHAVWVYFKNQELEHRQDMMVNYQKLLPDSDRKMAVLLSFCDSFGFAYMRYTAWYGGVGEKLLFNYPCRGKVRAKDIIVTQK